MYVARNAQEVCKCRLRGIWGEVELKAGSWLEIRSVGSGVLRPTLRNLLARHPLLRPL